MTVELFTEPMAYTVSGVGPYPIEWEYMTGSIVVTVEGPAGDVVLLEPDIAIDPAAGTSGNLMLSSFVATTYNGRRIIISRKTNAAQGWVGLESRERGLEEQLDRIVMVQQETQRHLQNTLRVRSGETGPLPGLPVDRMGRSIVFSSDGMALEYGPTANEISLAQSYAERAEAAMLATGDQAFRSFEEAQGADVLAVVNVIYVWHNSVLLGFTRRSGYTCLTTLDGGTWGPFGKTAYWEHWGISSVFIDPDSLSWDDAGTAEVDELVTIGSFMAAEPDQTEMINRALIEHDGIIHALGFVKHLGQVVWQRQCIVHNGTGNDLSAGFYTDENADFDVNHMHVGALGERGIQSVNLCFYAEQNFDAQERADLVRYPWAIDAGNSSRAVLASNRVVGYINGIDQRKRGRLSNAGGAEAIGTELGTFGIGVLTNDALDFVELDLKSWPFMFSGVPGLLSIFTDGRNDAARIEKCDGSDLDIKVWRTRVSLGRDAGVHLSLTGDVEWPNEGEVFTQAGSDATGVVDFVIAGPRTEVRLKDVDGVFDTVNEITGTESGALGAASVPTAVEVISALDNREIQYDARIKCDAPSSYLQLRGGSGRVVLYSSKVEAETQATIRATGGTYTIDSSIRSSTPDAIIVDGPTASVNFGDSWLRSELSNTRMAHVLRGHIGINSSRLQWHDGDPEGVPFIEVAAGASITATGNKTIGAETQRVVIKINEDHKDNAVHSNRFGPHQVSKPVDSPLGFYETDSLSSHWTNENTSHVKGVAQDNPTSAHNETFSRSGGTNAARTSVASGMDIKNQFIEVQTANGRVNIGQDRHRVGTVSGSNVGGQFDRFLNNAGGVLTHVKSENGDEVQYHTRLHFSQEGEKWSPFPIKTPQQFGWSADLTPAQQTDCIQDLYNSFRGSAGGTVHWPKATYTLEARQFQDGYLPGFVANDEMRRAYFAVLLYELENVQTSMSPGAMVDRSQDMIADTDYAVYSATLYASKCSNVSFVNCHLRGAQNDAALLVDDKNQTSGTNLAIGHDCINVGVYRCRLQDGTNGISVATNRDENNQSNSPLLGPVQNLIIRDTVVEGNEHFVLLGNVDGGSVDFVGHRWVRANNSISETQRGLYLHSCRNLEIRCDISGVFKTGVIVEDHAVVENIDLTVSVFGMKTNAEFLADVGPLDGDPNVGMDFSYQGHAVSVQSTTMQNIKITMPYSRSASVLHMANAGINGLTLVLGDCVGAIGGIVTSGYLTDPGALLNNPIRGLRIEGMGMGRVRVDNTMTGFELVEPVQNLLLDSGAIDGNAQPIPGEVTFSNIQFQGQNRNARILDFEHSYEGPTKFEYLAGLASPRIYDCNFNTVPRGFDQMEFTTHGYANGPDDGSAVDYTGVDVNPEFFGAIGDGVADDSAALARICAATLNVKLTAGKTYFMGTGSLVARTGQSFRGPGTLSKTSQGYNSDFITLNGVSKIGVRAVNFTMPTGREYGIYIVNSSHIEIEGCDFSGRVTGIYVGANTSHFNIHSNTFNGGQQGVGTGGTKADGQEDGRVEYGSIHRNRFENQDNEFVDINHDTHDVDITNNYMKYCGITDDLDAVDVGGNTACTNISIAENTIDCAGGTLSGINIKQGTRGFKVFNNKLLNGKRVAGNGSGILIANSSEGVAFGNTIEGFYRGIKVGESNEIRVSDNHLTDISYYAIGTDGVQDSNSISITNNYIDKTQVGANASTESAINVAKTNGAIITGNKVVGAPVNGIEINSSASNVLVDGNECRNCSVDGIVVEAAGTIINGNKCHLNGQYGLDVSAAHVTATNNIAKNNNQSAGSYYGIRFQAGSNYAVISGNRAWDDQGSKTQRGFTFGASDRCIVSGNFSYGNASNNWDGIANLTNSVDSANITS